MSTTVNPDVERLYLLFDVRSDKIGRELLQELKRGPVSVERLEKLSTKEHEHGGAFSEAEALGKLSDMMKAGLVSSEWKAGSPPQRVFSFTTDGSRLAALLDAIGLAK